MNHFIYILQCVDGTLYSGYTTDVSRRVREHNGEEPGGARYTRGRRPVRLVYHEVFTNRSDAQKREAAIKKLSRSEKLSLFSGA